MAIRNYELLNAYFNGLSMSSDPEFDEDEKEFIGTLEEMKDQLESINEWNTVIRSIGALCAVFSTHDDHRMSRVIGDTRETLERRLYQHEYAVTVIDLFSKLFVTGSAMVDNSWITDMSGHVK